MTKPSWLPSFLWTIWCWFFPASAKEETYLSPESYVPEHTHEPAPAPPPEPIKQLATPSADEGFTVEELSATFADLVKEWAPTEPAPIAPEPVKPAPEEPAPEPVKPTPIEQPAEPKAVTDGFSFEELADAFEQLK